MITPYPYQIEIAKKAKELLRSSSWAYLAMEERTGKTLTALLAVEDYNKILIITKKKALEGIMETLNLLPHLKNKVTLTNYHQVKHIKQSFDVVILDEAHAYLSAIPKQGVIYKEVEKVVKNTPILYLSATPYAEHIGQIYPQLKLLGAYSPFWEFNTFYQFFDVYGISKVKKIPYGYVNDYTHYHNHKVLEKIKSNFIWFSRDDAGFEYSPTDNLIYVNMDKTTKDDIKKALRTLVLDGEPLDSPMKLRNAIYQREGGVYKDKIYLNIEKITKIKELYGDSDKIVIMHHFVNEGKKLRQHFKNALILQGDAYAEGVDLHQFDKLIIYSMSYSTSKYIQRRARQSNKQRDKPIEVDYLLVKRGLSEAVYNQVAKKHKNFTKRSFDNWVKDFNERS